MPTSKVHTARSVVSNFRAQGEACPEIWKSLKVLGGKHEKVEFDRGPVGI
jgi:hypothetical protein